MALNPTNPTSRTRALYAGLALVACTAAVATYLLAPVGASNQAVAEAAAPRSAAPTAAEFAHNFVGTTNAFAAASGDATRIRNADCVQASRGHYMCSYAAQRPGAPVECHIMQAQWTPNAASTITITLAGHAARCASLPDALDSLS